jgi:hypothetical protein
MILHFRGAPAKAIIVATVDQASQVMRQHIEKHNYGASDMEMMNGQVFNAEGMRCATVQYNGRVDAVLLEGKR